MAIRAIVRYAAPYKAFFNALKCQQTAVLMCRAQSCKTIVLKLFLHSVGFIHKNILNATGKLLSSNSHLQGSLCPNLVI